MFIHIGKNIIVSDRKCIGIFSIETLAMNSENDYYLKGLSPEYKVIAVDENNRIQGSPVSPFTVIKRKSINQDEIFWSRKDD